MGRGPRRPLSDLAQRVIKHVNDEIERRGLPATTALDRVLVSHDYAFKRIKGRIALDLNDLQRIAEFFEVSPYELLLASQPASQPALAAPGVGATQDQLGSPARTGDAAPIGLTDAELRELFEHERAKAETPDEVVTERDTPKRRPRGA